MIRTSTILAVLLACASAYAAPSVAVQTVAPRQGALPDLVEAFGSAAPAVNGGTTISLQQDGRIVSIDVTSGESVRQGQALLQFGQSPTAASAYQQAVSALSLARQQREHTAQLLRQQLATRDQLAQADKALSDAQSTLDALKREGGGQAVRSVPAPFDGIVTTIAVSQGQHTTPSTPLITLTRQDGLVVTVGVEPAVRGRLRAGQAAKLIPLWGGPALDGTVLRIDNMLNPRTRLIDVDLSAPASALLSGEAFRSEITVGEFAGWLVPHASVLTDGKGAYVFQIANGKAKRIDVEIRVSRGESDVVTGPVDTQLPLVVQGNYQLSDGMDVRPATAQEAQR